MAKNPLQEALDGLADKLEAAGLSTDPTEGAEDMGGGTWNLDGYFPFDETMGDDDPCRFSVSLVPEGGGVAQVLTVWAPDVVDWDTGTSEEGRILSEDWSPFASADDAADDALSSLLWILDEAS